MKDGTQDELEVSFPASSEFTRIGRVTVASLAMRLGIDISTVDALQDVCDHAVLALQGDGKIDVAAKWEPNKLSIKLTNTQATISQEDKTRLEAIEDDHISKVAVSDSEVEVAIQATGS